MDKETIIKQANANIKNEKLSTLKDDYYNNTAGDGFNALMQYNALLDNVSIGAHTTTIIELYGLEWKFRRLTADEIFNIQLEVKKESQENQIFDDFFVNYKTARKILALALSPSPFKKEGTAILSWDDLGNLDNDVFFELFKQYQHFLAMSNKDPQEFTAEEVENIINVAKKKPTILKELERSKLLITASYLLNYLKGLEKIQNEDKTNLSF